jgi:hypothetical protein
LSESDIESDVLDDLRDRHSHRRSPYTPRHFRRDSPRRGRAS